MADDDTGLDALEAYIAWRTLKHAEDQDSIAASLALALWPLWTIQRFTELDATTPAWLGAVIPQVEAAYLQSQRVAAVFAEDLRIAADPEAPLLPMELPAVQQPIDVPGARFLGDFVPQQVTDATEPHLVTFQEFPEDDARISLWVTGNSNIKAQMPAPEDELMDNARANSSGAAVRHAMNGGRNATGNVVFFDRKIIGYARVTDGNPCFFCALLASRGAVFKKDSFSTGGRSNPWNGALTKADKEFVAPKDGPELPDGFTNVAKVHDHCRCQLRPVYKNERSFGGKHEAHRDEEAQFYFDQWEKVARDNYWLSNKQQVQIFREQYRPFKREAVDTTDIRRELEKRDDALSASGVAPFAPSREWTRAQLLQLA